MKKEDLYYATQGDIVKVKGKYGIISRIWNTNHKVITPEHVRIWVTLLGAGEKEYQYRSVHLLGMNQAACDELANYCKGYLAKLSDCKVDLKTINEVTALSQEKKAQAMLLAEKYATADLNAALSYSKNEGRNEGRELERKLITYKYVSEGYLPVEKGAKDLCITVEELKRNMLLEGYKFPEQ